MSNSAKRAISLDAVIHIARVCERLPRLQTQIRISRSFRPRHPANLGSKIRFWIRRKETPLEHDDQESNDLEDDDLEKEVELKSNLIRGYRKNATASCHPLLCCAR